MASKIHVTVYTDRNHVGKLTVIANDEDIESYEVAAQSGNDAHPGIGYYELMKTVDVPLDNADALSAYGGKIVYFIQEGSTNQADVIVIHGGDTDEDGHLFVTEERGLRLSNENLVRLLLHIKNYGITTLELEEKPLGFFKHFTTRRVSQLRPRYVDSNSYNSYTSTSMDDSPFFWMWLYDQNNYTYDQQHGFAGFGSGNSGGAGASGDFGVSGDPVIIDPFKEEVKHTPVQHTHTQEQQTFVPPVNMFTDDEPVHQSFETHHYTTTSTSY